MKKDKYLRPQGIGYKLNFIPLPVCFVPCHSTTDGLRDHLSATLHARLQPARPGLNSPVYTAAQVSRVRSYRYRQSSYPPLRASKLYYSVSKVFQSKAFKKISFHFTSIVLRDHTSAALISIQLGTRHTSTQICF